MKINVKLENFHVFIYYFESVSPLSFKLFVIGTYVVVSVYFTRINLEGVTFI